MTTAFWSLVGRAVLNFGRCRFAYGKLACGQASDSSSEVRRENTDRRELSDLLERRKGGVAGRETSDNKKGGGQR
jgi:hypothetical protein